MALFDFGGWFTRIVDRIVAWGGYCVRAIEWLWDGIKQLPSFGIAFAGACVSTTVGYILLIKLCLDNVMEGFSDLQADVGQIAALPHSMGAGSYGSGIYDYMGFVNAWFAADHFLVVAALLMGVWSASILVKFVRSIIPVI